MVVAKTHRTEGVAEGTPVDLEMYNSDSFSVSVVGKFLRKVTPFQPKNLLQLVIRENKPPREENLIKYLDKIDWS